MHQPVEEKCHKYSVINTLGYIVQALRAIGKGLSIEFSEDYRSNRLIVYSCGEEFIVRTST